MQAAGGEMVAGTYRQRLTLTSGRFAMIDNGLGFALVRGRRRSTGISAAMSPASPWRAAGSSGVLGATGGWQSEGIFQKKTGLKSVGSVAQSS